MKNTYGDILNQMTAALNKQAFIPPPSQQDQSQGQGQPQGGQDPSQSAKGQGSSGGGQPPQGQGQGDDGGGGQSPQGTQGQPTPFDELQGNEASMQQNLDAGTGQDPNQVGEHSEGEVPNGLKHTKVTVSVADLLDLHSGGKVTQNSLKIKDMKLKQHFKTQQLLRQEQRRDEEIKMKEQQQAQQQAMNGGMMNSGGLYNNASLGGAPQGQPGQNGQPNQPGLMPSGQGGM